MSGSHTQTIHVWYIYLLYMCLFFMVNVDKYTGKTYVLPATPREHSNPKNRPKTLNPNTLNSLKPKPCVGGRKYTIHGCNGILNDGWSWPLNHGGTTSFGKFEWNWQVVFKLTLHIPGKMPHASVFYLLQPKNLNPCEQPIRTTHTAHIQHLIMRNI